MKLFSFLFLFSNFLFAQDSLKVSYHWKKFPTICNSKDGVLLVYILGGTPPYSIYSKKYNSTQQDSVSLLIKDVDYKYRDTFYISDSNKPIINKIISIVPSYTRAYAYFTNSCVQKDGQPDQLFKTLDSVKKINYPFRLTFSKFTKSTGYIQFIDSFLVKSKSDKSINYTIPVFSNSDLQPYLNVLSIGDYQGCYVTGSFYDENRVDTYIEVSPKTIHLDANSKNDKYITLESNRKAPYLSIQWFKNDEKFYPTSNTKFKVEDIRDTKYHVVTIDEYNCRNEKWVNVYSKSNDNPAYFPTAFSPNDDGINDNFTVFSDEKVEQIKEFIIFDRWGGEIFKTSNIPVSDESKGWNGKAPDNELMPQGNYTYFCRLRLKDGNEKSIKGEVMLMR